MVKARTSSSLLMQLTILAIKGLVSKRNHRKRFGDRLYQPYPVIRVKFPLKIDGNGLAALNDQQGLARSKFEHLNFFSLRWPLCITQ